MDNTQKAHVYHGSHELFDIVQPKRNLRSKIDKNGNEEIIYDDISFHATPYYWIALAYTYTPRSKTVDGIVRRYNIGVSLYELDKVIEIEGFGSLEESLTELYGNNGYVYTFNSKDFFHTKGLGNLEVVTKENLKPIKITHVEDPVSEMKKIGVVFRFKDLSSE